MDAVAPPTASDAHTAHHPSHNRQSILGSFLRGRPRGNSQSQPSSPFLQVATDSQAPNMAPPPSPGPGHRRRPAAGALQASVSHTFSTTTANATGGFSQILRRRRSANGALPTNANANSNSSANAAAAAAVAILTGEAVPSRPTTAPANAPAHRIRFVPHLDSHRSLHFDPIQRDVREGDTALRIGRFTDRSGLGLAAANAAGSHKLAFKSKVVSRGHAEVWVEAGGKFFIKDTKSSSGTFLNHIRLSPPNAESRPFQIKDGDVLQLGVDYQGGTEDIYKCVKMRIEVGREWQAGPNAFNKTAMKQLKALSGQITVSKAKTVGPNTPSSKSGISDCCICLFQVSVHQSLFISPCSHVFHYKCIRPLLTMHHPGFSCPLCRTFANLEEDVEVEAEFDFQADDDEPKAVVVGEPMDIDGAAASAVLAAAAAMDTGTGAETEIEREPSRPRRRVRDPRAGVAGVPENAEDDDDDEEDWPLLAVPAPGPSSYAQPPATAAAAISRPMSAPPPSGLAGAVQQYDAFGPRTPARVTDELYEGDDNGSGFGSGEGEGEGEADADVEGNGDGSSGEGQIVDDRERAVGEKRKR